MGSRRAGSFVAGPMPPSRRADRPSDGQRPDAASRQDVPEFDLWNFRKKTDPAARDPEIAELESERAERKGGEEQQGGIVVPQKQGDSGGQRNEKEKAEDDETGTKE